MPDSASPHPDKVHAVGTSSQSAHAVPPLACGTPQTDEIGEYSPTHEGRLDFPHSFRGENYRLAGTSFNTTGLSPQRAPETHAKQPRPRQTDFSFARLTELETLRSRLTAAAPEHRETEAIANCHTDWISLECGGCGARKIAYNRCERRFCPLCARRIASERCRQFEFWFERVKSPKLLTLTLRNVEALTPEYLAAVKKAWGSLRRSKLFRACRGGFWAMEITNKGRGWHVHIHALLDVVYLPQAEIEAAWSKRIRQAKSMVDIRACRDKKSLREVAKYTTKPAEMLHWSNEDIVSFLDCVAATRMFGTWGELYKHRGEFKEFQDALLEEWCMCECGCADWTVVDRGTDRCSEPNWEPLRRPPPNPQRSLGLDMSAQQNRDAIAR